VTAYDWLAGATGISDVPALRGTLGAVLLSGDDAMKRASDLSGGESARLLLAALMLQKPNLLLLDEPTNHLDLEGREALMRALTAFPGTVLFVSHDRHFVSSVGTRVLALSVDGLEDFRGDYEEYLAKQGEDYLSVASVLPGRKDSTNGSDRASYTDRKDRRRRLAMLRRAVERLERQAGDLERELAELETTLGDPGYYQATPRQRLEEDVRWQEELKARLASTVAEWEESATELEGLEVEAG
jgi:ABC-type multidrug transport system ATPase subunit